VRYGNVIGSRGSMVPFFIKQKKMNRPFTLTHQDMTRFSTSLDDAAKLVINAEKKMIGGEIFVNKNPSIRVKDFLKFLDKKRRIIITGVRPGEKISEVLITNDEARYAYDFGKYYKIIPSILNINKNAYIKGSKKKVDRNFFYSSDTNTRWLTLSQIKKIINDEEKKVH